MATQRIWRRVEAPGTFRGHALVADLHGVRWYAWEQRDGSWHARRGEGAPTSFGSWTELRTTAERGPNPAPEDPVAQVQRVLGVIVRRAGKRPDGDGLWVTVKQGYGRLAYAWLVARAFPYDVRIMEVP